MTNAPPSLLALEDICKSFDGREVVRHVDLSVDEGQVACLLGPSGCGKSTTLRIAAGVEQQTSGSVSIAGQRISDETVHLPPEQRSVGLMFQDFALFPHLTVAQNVAFGLTGSRSLKEREAVQLLERVGIADLKDRYPHLLSGGEQQRVALVRALAPRPRILLMDEPFSGLDDRLRDDVRDETLAILAERGTAALLVTHDPGEAMRMGDKIALMRGGQIVQSGAPYNLYNAPIDRAAAAFFSDVNVIRGRVQGASVDTPFGAFLAPGHADGTRVEIVIRPQHLRLDFDRKEAPPRPTETDGVPARGAVVRSRFLGNQSLVQVRMEHDGSLLNASIAAVFLPQPGTIMWLSMRRDRCHVFPEAA